MPDFKRLSNPKLNSTWQTSHWQKSTCAGEEGPGSQEYATVQIQFRPYTLHFKLDLDSSSQELLIWTSYSSLVAYSTWKSLQFTKLMKAFSWFWTVWEIPPGYNSPIHINLYQSGKRTSRNSLTEIFPSSVRHMSKSIWTFSSFLFWEHKKVWNCQVNFKWANIFSWIFNFAIL